MTAALDRAFAAVDLLSCHPEGLPVHSVATALGLPASATHRLLNDLVRLGHVRQVRAQGDYALTMRLAALGLGWLGRTGIPDVVQPVLDHLAARTGELVRLSVADGDRLIWVAVAQGATSGLRYDPAREQGVEAPLAYSASGRAWAASLPQDRALALIAAQGLEPPVGAREGSRMSLAEVLAELELTVERGHAEAVDCFLDGMAAIAAPIGTNAAPSAVLSIAGPAVRLNGARRAELLAPLRQATEEVASLVDASPLLRGRA